MLFLIGSGVLETGVLTKFPSRTNGSIYIHLYFMISYFIPSPVVIDTFSITVF